MAYSKRELTDAIELFNKVHKKAARDKRPYINKKITFEEWLIIEERGENYLIHKDTDYENENDS